MEGARRAWFNLAGTSLSIAPEPRTRPEWLDRGYQAAAVGHPGLPSVVDDIEAMMGLPRFSGTHPSTTPPILCVRAIAGLAQRLAFGTRQFVADSGFLDSSGYDDVGVCDWVNAVAPEAYDAARALQNKDWKSAAKIGARYWKLSRCDEHAAGFPWVAIDLKTAEASVVVDDAVIERHNLWELFNDRNRTIGPVTEWLLSRFKT